MHSLSLEGLWLLTIEQTTEQDNNNLSGSHDAVNIVLTLAYNRVARR